jgi:riboflavin biosynthesis pyrimidine reductase
MMNVVDGELARSLVRVALVDRYVLLVRPLVLGSGRRLFPESDEALRDRLELLFGAATEQRRTWPAETRPGHRQLASL